MSDEKTIGKGCVSGFAAFVIGCFGLSVVVPAFFKLSNPSDVRVFSGVVSRYDCYEKSKSKRIDCYIWLKSDGKTIRVNLNGDKFLRKKFEQRVSLGSPLSIGIDEDEVKTRDTTNYKTYTASEIKDSQYTYLSKVSANAYERQKRKEGIWMYGGIAFGGAFLFWICGGIEIIKNIIRRFFGN